MKLSHLTIFVILLCWSVLAHAQNFDTNYALNTSNLLFPTESLAAIGMRFKGPGIGGTLMMKQFNSDEMKIYRKYPIVNVPEGNELNLLGVCALNLTNAEYESDDGFQLYMSYFMGVFNSPPDYLNLLLLDDSNRFVPLPNEIRERIAVSTKNATFNLYENTIQNKVVYMGIFGKLIFQQSTIDTYVNISYPQIVNYHLNPTLNQTLDVYYYDWYGNIPADKPNRYMMINVNDEIKYPAGYSLSLIKFKIIGAPGQGNQQPYYNGYGLRNYVFHFDANELLDYYSKELNETLILDSLACGYQKKNSDIYIDNKRSQVDVNKGILTCDDTLGDEVQSVTLMVKTIQSVKSNKPIQSTKPIVSSSSNPSFDNTLIVAVTASAFGAVLLLIGIITIVAMICCLRRKDRYDEIQ